MIDDKTKIYSPLIENLTTDEQSAYKFFYVNTAHIEIIFKNKIYTVYFTIQPTCKLSLEVKRKFLSQISIETPFDKLNGII